AGADALIAHDPGGVDQHVDVRVFGEDAPDEVRDTIGAVDVDRHRRHVRATGAGLFERVTAAPCDDDLVAQVVKAVGERLADARSAAGDEDGVASEFHGAFSEFAVEADPFIPLLTVRKKAPKRFILTVWRVTMGVPPPKPWPDSDPRVDDLVTDVIGQVADTWRKLIREF